MHDDPIRTDADQVQRAQRSPAYAKAKVIRQLADVAAGTPLSSTAQLLVQHLLTLATPHDDGWIISVSNESLANRLSRNEGTIRRLLSEVDRHLSDVVHRTPGRGCGARNRASCYLIDVRSLEERAGALPGERAGALPYPYSNSPSENAVNHHQHQEGAGRAGGGGGALILKPLTPDEESLLRRLLERPYWLSPEQGWLDEVGARRLIAELPKLNAEHVDFVRRDVGRSAKSLRNPAGRFINNCRALVASIAAARKEQTQ